MAVAVFDGALAAAVDLNTPGPTSSEQLLAKGGVDKLADADAAAPLVAEKADLSSEGSGFSPLNSESLHYTTTSESDSDEPEVVWRGSTAAMNLDRVRRKDRADARPNAVPPPPAPLNAVRFPLDFRYYLNITSNCFLTDSN